MNQLEPGGFLQGNDDSLTRDDMCDLTNLVTDGGAMNLQNFSIDHTDNWNFGILLALAHAAGATAAVESALADIAFIPLFSSHNADGSSVSSSRISSNLNSPPGRDAASGSNSFQFAPITPVQNKGRQSMLNLNLNLNINEIPILQDVQENVEESDLQGNKEQSVLVRELSEMMENHKPDKTGELVAEANQTPQQKPRRKKHRPKVVVEGEAKRANKPRAPNTPGTEEIKAEKRKYTPRKGVDNPAATPLDEGSHIINPEMMSPGSSKTPKVDRKRPKRNRGAATPKDEDSNVSNPETIPPGSKETSKVKRMYPQRNQGQKPTKEPIEEGSSETIQPETASRPRRSSRRFLNFDFVDLEEYENFIEPSSNFDNLHVKNICEQVKSMPAMLKRKRSKGLTRVRDLASLHEICKQFPTYSSREAAAKHHTGHLNTCMEALVADTRPTMKMKTKKRSKRNSLNGTVAPNTQAQHQYIRTPIGSLPALPWRGSSPIDEIVERFTYLNRNADNQGQYTLSTRNVKFQRETALVLYQRDGTIAPFTGVKKRKPRPKVDLDDETTTVWKLLLQNINSRGIDGTDEEKTKWWEEERKVFRRRADSFIARMRLVQGDRRFSPWKGSVVDSVVGVFLTQNVSDHLSSSAFMSMAARFPLKSKISEQSHEERTNITIEEPEVCIMDPDDTIAWHENSLNQPTPGQDSMAFREMGCKDEVVNSELTEGTSNCIKSTENFRAKDVDSSEKDPEDVHYGLTLYRPAKWINEEEASFHSGQTEPDNVLSSQNSGVSSQNSVNSSHTQTVDITESTSLCSTSFIQLLQMVGTSMLRGVYNQENSSANMDMPNQQRDCSAEFQKNKEDDKLPVNVGEHYALEQNESSTESPIQATNQKIIAGENTMVNSDSQIHTEESNCNLVLDQECPTSLDIQDITGRASTVVDSLSNSDGQNEHLDTVDKRRSNPSKEKGGRSGTEKQDAVNWDHLRQQALASGKKRERTMNTMDSLDWEAVRCADVNEIAETIKERGMNNMLAERIQDFLNRLGKEHGSTDLEWLRDVPPDKAKEYLLSFRGLGLKSVECVRLLTLHHLAFPVDTNVGRIVVRLGWVPLQPLPESLQLHLLELYPVLDSIQKYLWPRLCKLDQGTLYELHYHMITFGKVFCTKSKPNCNACPMRGECRHFASAFASARLALPAPEDKSIVPAFENKPAEQNTVDTINPLQLLLPQSNEQSVAQYGVNNSQPIIEEPIIEVPTTPVPEQIPSEADIEDAYSDDPNEIPTINLNLIQLAQNVKMFVKNNMELNQVEMSKALVALTPEAASIPMPKLKNISRLRTEHHVYELPDTHPLLERLEKRDPDDPCSYLLAIWTPGETVNSVQPPEMRCDSQESGKLCQEETCFPCNSIREAHSQTVRGTLLVFADHESSLNPIDVPRVWLWDLHRKTVFFGTSIPTIFKGLSTEDIQHCFWRGYVCVRGFDWKKRAPRPLMARLHFPASRLTKTKRKTDES